MTPKHNPVLRHLFTFFKFETNFKTDQILILQELGLTDL